jgi:methane monooxygenase PmoA-like
MIRLPCIAVSFVVAARAFGASSSFELTVAAGQHERNNVPVRVQMPRGQIGKDQIASVTLARMDGQLIAAQWTGPGLTSSAAGELHFVLPHLAAGESVRLKATLSTQSPSSAGGFTWHDHPGHHTDLMFGERPIMTYHYERLDESTPASRVRTYKVFHHVFSPKGDRIVTGGLNEDPKVHSPHHRGIFYGFNRITYGDGKRADTWHCIDGAFQQHERFLASEQGPVLARQRVVISWHGKDVAFAEEERELTVYNVPGGHLIEFASRLGSTTGRVRIDGDPQHAGFQFRAHNDVDAYTTNETIFVRPEGIGKPGETRNWDPQTGQGPANMPWNAMSFVLGGKRYTVAYLDHPGNPKEARFSEREYGRFGSYFEYTIEKDKPLTVNYRLWLQEGLMQPEQVAALSNNFVEPVKVTVHEPK